MIIIDMNERKYKRTLREYSPPFNPNDWQAVQHQLKMAVRPLPWWQHKRLWTAAAILLLTSLIALYCTQQPLSTPLVASSSLPAMELNIQKKPLVVTSDNLASTDVSPMPMKQKPSNSVETPQNRRLLLAKVGDESQKSHLPPMTNIDSPTAINDGNELGKEAVLASAWSGLDTSIITTEGLGLPLLATIDSPAGEVIEQQSRLPQEKAVLKGERFWQLGVGIWPQPKNTEYDKNSLLMAYVGYHRVIAQKLSVGLAVGIHRYTNTHRVFYESISAGLYQETQRTDNYYAVNLGVNAAYYPVVKPKWAWYVGALAGYRKYVKPIGLADDEYSLALGVPEDNSAPITDFVRNDIGLREDIDQGKLWLGLHTGIKTRIYRRWGAFAEVGYQPSTLRFGITFSGSHYKFKTQNPKNTSI